ncbi:MAG: N-acetyltransferase family protein [Candidatus Nanohaloarchaea archaeon]
MAVNIRVAEASDTEDITEMWNMFMRFHEEYHHKFVTLKQDAEKIYREKLEKDLENPDSLYLIVEEDKEVIGYLSASIEEHPEILRQEKLGEISKVFVKKEKRGQGIGEKLEKKAEEWFKKKSIDLVKARVIEGNEGADKFWKDNSFQDHISVKFKEI